MVVGLGVAASLVVAGCAASHPPEAGSLNLKLFPTLSIPALPTTTATTTTSTTLAPTKTGVPEPAPEAKTGRAAPATTTPVAAPAAPRAPAPAIRPVPTLPPTIAAAGTLVVQLFVTVGGQPPVTVPAACTTVAARVVLTAAGGRPAAAAMGPGAYTTTQLSGGAVSVQCRYRYQATVDRRLDYSITASDAYPVDPATSLPTATASGAQAAAGGLPSLFITNDI